MQLPDFQLEIFFSRWEFAARHNLAASDAQTLTIGELLEFGDREAFEALPLSYAPTWGTDDLLSAIASTYEAAGPEHVLAFAGAEEAMYWALQELLGPGDHAVVTVPNYQSMESLAIATGADVSGLVLRGSEGWALDLDALEALLRPSTRVVAVNFPNNPTGAMPDGAALTRLAELCDERGIRLFSDEVYRGLEAEPLPQAADLSARSLSLNVMSKAHGLPGLRVGWLACRDRALLERLERRKHYTTICNAVPSEHLAALALRNGAAIRARNRAIVAENVPVFEAFFADRAVEWEAPQGGCVCFPRLTTGEPTSTFCRRLVEEAGVILLPADVFASELGEVPSDRFRLGAGRRDPGPALEALGRFMSI